jgi:hypothetical protein
LWGLPSTGNFFTFIIIKKVVNTGNLELLILIMLLLIGSWVSLKHNRVYEQ